eukprot:1847929-Rhodomonas_salina.1
MHEIPNPGKNKTRNKTGGWGQTGVTQPCSPQSTALPARTPPVPAARLSTRRPVAPSMSKSVAHTRKSVVRTPVHVGSTYGDAGSEYARVSTGASQYWPSWSTCARTGLGQLSRKPTASDSRGNTDRRQPERASGQHKPHATSETHATFGPDQVVLHADDHLAAAALAVRHDRDEVAHGAGGHEEAGLLLEHGRRQRLQLQHRRVVSEHVVPHLRVHHRLPQPKRHEKKEKKQRVSLAVKPFSFFFRCVLWPCAVRNTDAWLAALRCLAPATARARVCGSEWKEEEGAGSGVRTLPRAHPHRRAGRKEEGEDGG